MKVTDSISRVPSQLEDLPAPNGLYQLWRGALTVRLSLALLAGSMLVFAFGALQLIPLIEGRPGARPLSPSIVRLAFVTPCLVVGCASLAWAWRHWRDRGRPRGLALTSRVGLLAPGEAALCWADISSVQRVDRSTLGVSVVGGRRLLFGGPLAGRHLVEALACDIEERRRGGGEASGSGAAVLLGPPTAAGLVAISVVAIASALSLGLLLQAIGAPDWPLASWLGLVLMPLLTAIHSVILLHLDGRGVVVQQLFTRPRPWRIDGLSAVLHRASQATSLSLRTAAGDRVRGWAIGSAGPHAAALAELMRARGARLVERGTPRALADGRGSASWSCGGWACHDGVLRRGEPGRALRDNRPGGEGAIRLDAIRLDEVRTLRVDSRGIELRLVSGRSEVVSAGAHERHRVLTWLMRHCSNLEAWPEER